jgi:Ser-tRNA(Ala) deacylase AlaX
MYEQLYYTNPYQEAAKATVISCQAKGNQYVVELSATNFYPQGGGQPSDQGEIVGPKGRMKVELTQIKDGRITHQGKMMGQMTEGDDVSLQVKWTHRLLSMRLHTAGHAIHDAMMLVRPDLVPIKANHGHSNSFVEYTGSWADEYRATLEDTVTRLVQENPAIIMRESGLDEIQINCRHVPKGLPANKPLRVVRIGAGELVPCGGVHVAQLAEVGKIVINGILTTP